MNNPSCSNPEKPWTRLARTTKVVSPEEGKIKGWNHKEWGQEVPVDLSLSSANANDFDALLLPGGVMNPDHLRMNPQAVEFVKSFTDSGQAGRSHLPRPVDAHRGGRC